MHVGDRVRYAHGETDDISVVTAVSAFVEMCRLGEGGWVWIEDLIPVEEEPDPVDEQLKFLGL